MSAFSHKGPASGATSVKRAPTAARASSRSGNPLWQQIATGAPASQSAQASQSAPASQSESADTPPGFIDPQARYEREREGLQQRSIAGEVNITLNQGVSDTGRRDMSSTLGGTFSTASETLVSNTRIGFVVDPNVDLTVPISPEFGGGWTQIQVFPVHVRYQREIEYTDRNGRNVSIRVNISSAFTQERWQQQSGLLASPDERQLMAMMANQTEVEVGVGGGGGTQDRRHLYHGLWQDTLRDTSAESALRTVLQRGAGNVDRHGWALRDAAAPFATVGEQYDAVHYLLSNIDADEAERWARYEAEQRKGWLEKIGDALGDFFTALGNFNWGMLKGAFNLVAEPFKMVTDILVSAAGALGAATGWYDLPVEKYMFSAIGKMAAQGKGTGEILLEMGKGIVLTPYRLVKALAEGNWEAAGEETTNLLVIIFGPKLAKGAPRVLPRGAPLARPPLIEPPMRLPTADVPPAARAPIPEVPAPRAPAVEPPAPRPAAVEPPAARPPAAEVPVAEPPATRAPTAEPPVAEPPAGRPAAPGAEPTPAAPVASRVPAAVADSLGRNGFTQAALDALDRAGFDLSSNSARFVRQLRSAGAQVQNFINDFHAASGFDRVVQDWAAGGGKRSGASFVMRYANGRLRGQPVAFEWPAGRVVTETFSDATARYVDVVELGTGRWLELKSWMPETLGRSAGRLKTQLMRDTAMAGPEGIRWVFDAAKPVSRGVVVDTFTRIILDDPWLKMKWGGSEAAVRAAVESAVETF